MTFRTVTCTVGGPDRDGRWRWNVWNGTGLLGTGSAVDEYAAWCAVRAAALDAIEQAAVDAATEEEGTR